MIPWQFMVPHPFAVPRCALSGCRLVHAVQPRYPGFGEPVRLVHGTADASRRPGNCGGAKKNMGRWATKRGKRMEKGGWYQENDQDVKKLDQHDKIYSNFTSKNMRS